MQSLQTFINFPRKFVLDNRNQYCIWSKKVNYDGDLNIKIPKKHIESFEMSPDYAIDAY